MNVKCSQSEDHQKRRKDKRGARESCAQSPAVYPAQIFRKLGRKGPGTKLRKGKALEVVLLRNPLPVFHQVPLHVTHKGNRSAEPERAQTKKIKQEGAQRWPC